MGVVLAIVGFSGTAGADEPVWAAMVSGTMNNLTSVWGTGPNNVFAVGYSGTILHYDGSAWSPMDSNTTQNLEGVWGSGPNDVYAVGKGGTILRYNGLAWTPIIAGLPPEEWFSCVWGSGPNDVFVATATSPPHVGAHMYHYDGSSWTLMSDATVDGWFNNIWGTGPNDVFAVGCEPDVYNGLILHYNGSAWSRMPSAAWWDVGGVWGSGPNDVYAGEVQAAGSGRIHHYDGATWSVLHETPEWCVLVWGAGASDVFFVGCEPPPSYAAAVLHFDGAAWQKMTCPAGAQQLQSAWGNENDVFAVGYNGTILHFRGCKLTITITRRPGLGEVAVDPDRCWFHPNEVVTLTAHAIHEDAKVWAGWSGDVDPNLRYTNPLTITMDSDKQISTGWNKCGAGVGPMLPLVAVGMLGLVVMRRRRK